MANNPSKGGPLPLEDGEINETNKTNSHSTDPSHKTYSILDNPLISNPSSTGPRHVSAKARKVIAWSKRLAMREAKARESQRAKESRMENKDSRRANRTRRYHPSRRLSHSRSDHSFQHRSRLETGFSDEDHESDMDRHEHPPSRGSSSHPGPHYHRHHEEHQHSQPGDQSLCPSDQPYTHQSPYPKPPRPVQLDHQPLHPSDQHSDLPSAYSEHRRSSYPPETSYLSRVPPSQYHSNHPHHPNLVPNYAPGHYRSYSQPSHFPNQPLHEYEAVDHPPFPPQQPLGPFQTTTVPAEYNSHSHQIQNLPSESYYPPQPHHSPHITRPLHSNHDSHPDTHPQYYTSDSHEQRREAFYVAPERPSQEPYPVYAPQSRPVTSTRFVSNYPVPPAHHDYHHSPQATTSSFDFDKAPAESYQTAPSLVHQSPPMEFEPNPRRHSSVHSLLEKDQLWARQNAAQRDHEALRVDPSHQHGRTQAFSGTEDPAYIPLGPPKQSHFYPSREHEDQALHGSKSHTAVGKHPLDHQSQWYPNDGDYVSQKKEAQEIMVRLISWGVTPDYLLSIGISESLIRGVYDR